MSKPKTNADPAYAEKLAQYECAVGRVPGLEVKGAANRYTAINGNMSSCLHPSGDLALRLPAEQRERFLILFATTLFESYGVVQKEYVAVPPALLADTEALTPYFVASYDYVAGLKPKPTTRKKG